ncbi:MAG: hypothetical protein ACRBN8_39650 [Nannocystales bacterium]
MSAFRIIGMVVVALGAVMAAFPGWFEPLTGGPGPAADTFAAIERRIRGGMVLGLGLVLIARTTLRPWSVTVASLLFYVLLGALLARILGLVIEGDDPRQWLYVALEGVLLALAALWLWHSSSGG